MFTLHADNDSSMSGTPFIINVDGSALSIHLCYYKDTNFIYLLLRLSSSPLVIIGFCFIQLSLEKFLRKDDKTAVAFCQYYINEERI